MMNGKMCTVKTGLATGLVFALIHLSWAVMVATKVAKPVMDWILGLHFLDITYAVKPFDWMTAATLIVFTFIVGYVLGSLFAWLWNMTHKKDMKMNMGMKK